MKKYGRSPLMDMMIVITNQKLAEQAKVNLANAIQNRYPVKMNETVPRIFSVGEKIEWLSMSKIDLQMLDEIDSISSDICRPFNVPPHLLNTGEHSKTFKK